MELLQLTPITEILDHRCNSGMSTEKIYSKLPNVLVPILISKLKNSNFCFSQVIRLCMTDARDVDICSGYPDVELGCINRPERFFLYLIDLVFIRNGRLSGRHSQALLVDNSFQTIEFFEPNGTAASWYLPVNIFLQNKFREIYPEYTFLSTGDFCPRVGPQMVSNQGICGSFSLLFLILRVFNESYTSGEIVDLLLTLSKEETQHLMRQFICYLDDYATRQNLYELQRIYDRMSERVANYPLMTNALNTLYYNLDVSKLEEFERVYQPNLYLISFPEISQMLSAPESSIILFEFLPEHQIIPHKTSNYIATFYSSTGDIYLVELKYNQATNEIFSPD